MSLIGVSIAYLWRFVCRDAELPWYVKLTGAPSVLLFRWSGSSYTLGLMGRFGLLSLVPSPFSPLPNSEVRPFKFSLECCEETEVPLGGLTLTSRSPHRHQASSFGPIRKEFMSITTNLQGFQKTFRSLKIYLEFADKMGNHLGHLCRNVQQI